MIDERDLYNESYFTGNGYGTDPRRCAAYLGEFDRLKPHISNGGTILDWGCGCGDFLTIFDDRWYKFGVEISGWARERAREKEIQALPPDDLGWLSPAVFDVIIFRGTLQHLQDPFGALAKAAELIKPGGILAILAQPDADSLCYRLFGELPALDPPRNWWIPGRRELTNILTRLWFEIVEVNRPYWGGPYAQPIRDYIRFIGRLFGLSRKPFAFPGNMIEIIARMPE